MAVLAVLVFLILFVTSIFHFVWAFGGTYGLGTAGPAFEEGADFKPSRIVTFIVACMIMALAILAIQFKWPWQWFEGYVAYIGFFAAFVFIVRAVGDFKYIGFFKKIYNSKFARLDTQYFSPLILFIGIGYAVLSFDQL